MNPREIHAKEDEDYFNDSDDEEYDKSANAKYEEFAPEVITKAKMGSESEGKKPEEKLLGRKMEKIVVYEDNDDVNEYLSFNENGKKSSLEEGKKN